MKAFHTSLAQVKFAEGNNTVSDVLVMYDWLTSPILCRRRKVSHRAPTYSPFSQIPTTHSHPDYLQKPECYQLRAKVHFLTRTTLGFSVDDFILRGCRKKTKTFKFLKKKKKKKKKKKQAVGGDFQ